MSTPSPYPELSLAAAVPFGSALDLTTAGVVVAGPDGWATFANRAWRGMTGQGYGDWSGHGWFEVIDEADRDAQRASLLSASRSGFTFRADWSLTGPDPGARVLNVTAVPALIDGTVHGLVATFVDVTEERANTERLHHQATHDLMTGLYNRPQFLEFVRHALDRQRRDRLRLAAVLFVDVDGLKAINDRFGHDAGDRVLQAAATHIAASVRPDDVAARYGGDEFAVLCDDLHDADEAESIAARIRNAIRDGAGDARALNLSVGVGLADDPGLGPAAVVARADRAMYLSRRVRERPRPAGTAPPRRTGSVPARDPEPVLTSAARELLSPLTTIAGLAGVLHRDRGRMSPEAVEAAFEALERQSGSLTTILEDLLERGRRHSGVSTVAEPLQ